MSCYTVQLSISCYMYHFSIGTSKVTDITTILPMSRAEVEKAKEFTKGKNKKAAIQCLKRKRLYEQQIEQLGNFQLRIHDQMIMLEGAKATTETVDALRTGAAAMKAMQKATNIDDVDKTMDEINEQTENMKQIQEALSTPIGAAADFDEVIIYLFVMSVANMIFVPFDCL
ncbi:vacuolar protein sorting-associated protein 32 homolog 2 [Lathyrus oleraceus]|uniref:vacuolar protein sorting-associated protein 32 homolog 2 n=1 Tax=Pisum sativum TaxID=3888 RepID=UPI0021D01971|nr:vacuolar protein sorting-associated protein 32 homolog 2-like [Pisum sativum]XP_050916707.1 vacuolar protein sorting-associated protein 32 homolog 2-like [Pisum sativum]